MVLHSFWQHKTSTIFLLNLFLLPLLEHVLCVRLLGLRENQLVKLIRKKEEELTYQFAPLLSPHLVPRHLLPRHHLPIWRYHRQHHYHLPHQ